jgi:hypothetical protein
MNSQLPLLQQAPLTTKRDQRDQEFPREYNRRTKKIVSIIGMLVLYYGGMKL